MDYNDGNSDRAVATGNPFGAPMYLMAKPAGAACNLRCEYCYYLEKGEGRQNQLMDDRTLREFTRQYIEAQTQGEVMFTWHGGEAMMRPISFYQKALEYQREFGGDRPILNCLQTNGTLINEQWAKFLRDNRWLVGISIDGPAEFHDEYRRDVRGRATHATVMRAIRLLQRYGIEWNAMAVVNDYNADHPREFYRFFKSIGCQFIQFTPIVERIKPDGRLATLGEDGELSEHSVTPEQWGRFLCGVYDEWRREDIGRIFVQIIDATLAGWVGEMPGVCSMAPTCGHAGVMEYNGDVYSCDHFVFPQYYLGNIHERTVTEMMYDPRQTQFGLDKRRTLPHQCRECQWTRVCNGECPKNRFAVTADGQPGLNFLCEGYRRYFAHVAKDMDRMADLLRRGLPPSLLVGQSSE